LRRWGERRVSYSIYIGWKHLNEISDLCYIVRCWDGEQGREKSRLNHTSRTPSPSLQNPVSKPRSCIVPSHILYSRTQPAHHRKPCIVFTIISIFPPVLVAPSKTSTPQHHLERLLRMQRSLPLSGLAWDEGRRREIIVLDSNAHTRYITLSAANCPYLFALERGYSDLSTQTLKLESLECWRTVVQYIPSDPLLYDKS
jgi:hypothetical protein